MNPARDPLGEILHGYMAAQQRILHARQWQDRAGRLRQTEGVLNMSADETDKPDDKKSLMNLQDMDGFQGYEDGVEGDDRQQSSSVIQGSVVKFTNEADWVTRNGEELTPTLELVAVDIGRVVQKWKDKQPVETIILEPGQKFPDLEDLNEKTPREEWTEGPPPDKKPQGPWQAQHIVYLLNPLTMDRYSFPTGTVGGAIAVRDLVDKTKWMRKFRRANVYPVVTLSDTFMKTRFGGRQRPNFLVRRWIGLSNEGTALPAPTPSPPTQPGVHKVEPPSLKEELNDDLSDFLK